jgi:CBS-domain-containing membrane protein
VAELLIRHTITAVPVLDRGGVVGIVSEYDLMAKSGETASDIMTPQVICVTEDTDVEEVRVLLLDRRIRRVPVLSGQQLVGIVSRSDIVGLLALEWICQVCGEPVRAESPPDSCPRCGQPREQFVQQEQPPGD